MKNSNRPIYLLLILIVIWLLVLSFRPNNNPNNENIQINENNVSGFSTDFTRIVEDNSDGIVTVVSDTDTASGFVYRQSEDTVYILSAYHCVEGAGHINVIFGSSYQCNAILVGYDRYCDLAVLAIKTPYEIKPLKLSDSTLLHAGEFVINIGTPLSQEYSGSVNMAMVALPLLSIENSITADNERENYYLDVIELSSNLVSGYSGSPVLNMNGEVCGMNTMALSEDISFALTINEIRKVADLIISGNEYKRNMLGIKEVYVKDMENYEKSNLNLNIDNINGIYIQKLRDDSIAYSAGIRQGDIILNINGSDINSLNDYLDICYADAGSFVFTVLRNGETLILESQND